MVPAAFVVLDALPLTPNGKVDRQALPAPGAERGQGLRTAAQRGRAPPGRGLGGVLKRPNVGVHDNFFALGGDSILSIQVVARARQRGCNSPRATCSSTRPSPSWPGRCASARRSRPSRGQCKARPRQPQSSSGSSPKTSPSPRISTNPCCCARRRIFRGRPAPGVRRRAFPPRRAAPALRPGRWGVAAALRGAGRRRGHPPARRRPAWPSACRASRGAASPAPATTRTAWTWRKGRSPGWCCSSGTTARACSGASTTWRWTGCPGASCSTTCAPPTSRRWPASPSACRPRPAASKTGRSAWRPMQRARPSPPSGPTGNPSPNSPCRWTTLKGKTASNTPAITRWSGTPRPPAPCWRTRRPPTAPASTTSCSPPWRWRCATGPETPSAWSTWKATGARRCSRTST